MPKAILVSSLPSHGHEYKYIFQGHVIDVITYLEHKDGRIGLPTPPT